MKIDEVGGVGKIVKGVNTTPDVQPGETERQAKKLFPMNKSGKPKPLGVPGASPNQAFNLGLVESEKQKDTLKGMDPKTVKAVQNLLIKFPHAKDPLTAIIADIEDSQAISIKNDKNNELRDKTLKHRIDKLEMRLSDLENKPSTNVAEDQDELSLIQRAEMFAQQAHKDHKRKYTGEPYYVHLDEVRRIVKAAGGSEDMQAAALLHDTVEDTATTSQDILKEFGPKIAKLVVELTDVSKPEDGNRKVRKGIDRDKLSMVSADAQTVKYADLISNGRDIGQNDPKFAKVYHAEKADLLRVMKKGNSNLRNAAIDMLPDDLRSIAMENMSVTGTELRRAEKKKGIEVGTPEWFKHWFDLPYLREDAGIQKVDIQQLERFADKLFGKVGIDVEFTRHFMDRVNDVRNQKPITMSELTRLFKQEYKRWGKPIAQMGPNSQAVMKDLQTDINLPFVLQWDDKNNELDLIAKTVMRKADFKTSNKEFPVENVPATNQAGTIGQHINWGGKNKPPQTKKVATRGTQNPQSWWQSMLQKGKNLFDDEQLDLKKKFEVTDELKKLANIFNRGGHEIRIVGGAVRDLALDKTPKDIDLASDATPTEMQKMFDSAGVRHIPTGIEHGTITAVINGEEFEITTLRADKETDGRHAEVEFVRSWEEDAKRRDLTYNAMSMDFEGNLYDYHGGMDDLQDKVTRFVGDPEERIKEDYLRTLRYFRFQGRLDTPTFDKDTMQAIASNTDGLKQLSVERVWMEMGKILSGSNIQQILSAMQKTSVLDAIGLNVKSSQDIMDGGDPIINLARITDDESIGPRWKMSNEEKSKLGFLISQKGQTHDKKWYTDQMADGFDRTQLDALARYNNQDDMIAYIKSFKAPEFPVDGNDLIKMGHERGPKIGQTLQALRNQWKKGNFSANKDELLKGLDKNKVDESLDNPYPFKLVGPNKTGTWVGKADTPNGPLVMDFDGNESQDDFSIDFAVNNRMGNEGTGDAFRIFATVMAIMNEWISKVGIEHVQQFDFNADKDEHDSDGRSRLYTRYANKLASQLGWGLRKSEVGNGSADFFSLQNPNPQKNENFADGKNPGRKGLSKRVGIPKGATLAQLEKIAKSSSGERRRMAQWQLNMRRGKNKSK